MYCKYLCQSVASEMCQSVASEMCQSVASEMCQSVASEMCQSVASEMCQSVASEMCKSVASGMSVCGIRNVSVCGIRNVPVCGIRNIQKQPKNQDKKLNTKSKDIKSNFHQFKGLSLKQIKPTFFERREFDKWIKCTFYLKFTHDFIILYVV